MKKSYWFHDCTCTEQEAIVQEIKKVIDEDGEKYLSSDFDEDFQEEVYQDALKKIKLIWEKSVVTIVPERFLDVDLYSNNYDDYFGLNTNLTIDDLFQISNEEFESWQESELESVNEWSENR